MSRNLYTFAVVTPALECEILDLLEAPESKKGPSRERRACDLVRNHIGDDRPPTVAFYREVLDGWNATHWIQHEMLCRVATFGKHVKDQINARGFWHAPAAPRGVRSKVSLSKLERHLRSMPRDRNWSGLAAYFWAWYHLHGLHQATRCPAFCFHMCCGTWYGENEFSIQVKEYAAKHRKSFPRACTLPAKPHITPDGWTTRAV